ncbi:MAG: hypothetical protein KDK39_19210 [Leptospiraceae bacterium]|nr:hypothetical protein [Leptospiraceae bacterium]
MEHSVYTVTRKIQTGEFEEAFQICRYVREHSNRPIDERFYYGAAVALFALGHVHQAVRWIEFYGEVSQYGPGYYFLLAYLELHKGHPEQSLLHWTHILELDPANTFADPLIDELRSAEGRLLSRSQDANFFHQFIPLQYLEDPVQWKAGQTKTQRVTQKERGRLGRWLFKNRSFWIRATFVVAAGFLVFGLVQGLLRLEPGAWITSAWETLQGVDVDLPVRPMNGTVNPADLYPAGDLPQFMYPDKAAALRDFSQARELIVQGRPNQARKLLGKLELSNASFEIKERVLQLRDAIPRTQQIPADDRISLADLHAQPYILRGAEIDLDLTRVEHIRVQERILRFYGLNSWSQKQGIRLLVLYPYGDQFDDQQAPALQSDQKTSVRAEFVEKKDQILVFYGRSLHQAGNR